MTKLGDVGLRVALNADPLENCQARDAVTVSVGPGKVDPVSPSRLNHGRAGSGPTRVSKSSSALVSNLSSPLFASSCLSSLGAKSRELATVGITFDLTPRQ